MRLNSYEIKGILTVFQTSLQDWNGKLFLFGSRTHSKKKGGDIDLLLVVPSENVNMAKSQKIMLIDKIQSVLGEQRIDLTIVSPSDLDRDPFLISIQDEMIALW